jgi:hypothetical protein
MRKWCLVIVLTFLSCIFTTAMPILNTELYELVPLPVFATAIQMSATVPLALFASDDRVDRDGGRRHVSSYGKI